MRELLGIVHDGLASGPTIDANYFPGTVSYRFWTSDTFAIYPSDAWIVSFYSGYADNSGGAYGKASNSYVRLVRSGQ